MAENKKSFILYADMLLTVEHLPDDVAGRLLKTILLYVNDKHPEPTDLIDRIAFEPIKQQLKRDLRRWDAKKENWSRAGKASAEARQKKKEQTSTNVETVPTESTVTVTDTVNVTVSENVTEKKSLATDRDSLVDQYFNDLPNSTALERISRNISVPIDQLRTFIPAFRKKLRLEYKSSNDFADHFKSWVLIELSKSPAVNETKSSLTFGKKK